MRSSSGIVGKGCELVLIFISFYAWAPGAGRALKLCQVGIIHHSAPFGNWRSESSGLSIIDGSSALPRYWGRRLWIRCIPRLDKGNCLCYNGRTHRKTFGHGLRLILLPLGTDERYGAGSNPFARHCAKEAALSICTWGLPQRPGVPPPLCVERGAETKGNSYPGDREWTRSE